LWAVDLGGDMTVKGMEMPIDVEFSDAVENLQMVFTSHFEARKNMWALLADISYLSLSASQKTPGPEVNVDLTNVLAELDLAYSLGDPNKSLFDVIAGVRYTSLDVDMNIHGGPKTNQGEGWADPIVGGRWWLSLGEQWSTVVRADFGGFGIGSEFTWNAMASVIWQPWEHVSLLGGYKGLGADYTTGSGMDEFQYNTTMHGPLLGVNIMW
ncbi:MAG: hypothetical protein GY801_51165, partial [bacterium]|nr:hypothetical protein [bacterium]